MCRVIRARCAELQITYDTLDVVAVLPDGYASKLLCEYPVKHIGALTLWSILGTLGFQIGLVTTDVPRNCGREWSFASIPPQSTGSRGRVKINFTYRFMRKIARLGGLKSGQVRHARSIKKQERSRIARTAALERGTRARANRPPSLPSEDVEVRASRNLRLAAPITPWGTRIKTIRARRARRPAIGFAGVQRLALPPHHEGVAHGAIRSSRSGTIL